MIILIAFLTQTCVYWVGHTAWEFYIKHKYVGNEKLFNELVADQADWTKPLLLRELRRIDRQQHRDKYTIDHKYYTRLFLGFSGLYLITLVAAIVVAVLDMFGVINL